MRGEEIPEDVRQFVVTHLRSIEQLEVLLLLNRTPERAWTPAEVYQSVLTNEQSIRQTLEILSSQDFIQRGQGEALTYQFAPKADSTKDIIARLVQIYKERPARIVQLIYAPPAQEIEAFAKAFRIRKEK